MRLERLIAWRPAPGFFTYDSLLCHASAYTLLWLPALAILLEDDVAMLAMMFS